MPIYEYRRPDGSTFEVMQKMSDPALTHDPETGELEPWAREIVDELDGYLCATYPESPSMNACGCAL